jgi:hypothetical protein
MLHFVRLIDSSLNSFDKFTEIGLVYYGHIMETEEIRLFSLFCVKHRKKSLPFSTDQEPHLIFFVRMFCVHRNRIGEMTRLWRAGDGVGHVDVNKWQRLAQTLDHIRHFSHTPSYKAGGVRRPYLDLKAKFSLGCVLCPSSAKHP